MYAFHARIIGRSQGKSTTKAASHNTGKRNSAVKASAYLSRSELTDAKGQTWDYSQHFGGGGSLLLLPPGAPDAFKDRQYLWQSVEKVENRSDSMLARDPIITMPWEFTQTEMWAAVTKFAKQEFVSQGKPVDLGLHIYGEPWRAWADATKAKIEVWKEQKFPFYEQGNVPENNTGPHVLIVRGKRNQIKDYYLYQPHMHLMTTFRSLDLTSPTGWAKHKDTVTKEHWAVADEKYLLHLKKAWADIGADALLAKGLTVEAARFRVGYMNLADQRREAIKRGDLEWARELDRKPEPKKGPIASKNEREDKGHESAEIIEWQKVKAENNEVRAINDRIAVLENEVIDLLAERLKRLQTEKAMSESPDDKRRKEADYQLAAEVGGLKTAEFQQLRAEDFIRANKEQSDRAKQDEEKLKAEQKARVDAGDITDAKARYAQASIQFDIRRPYASLCDVAAAENAAYHREQDNLAKQAADEKDPAKRQSILLRKDIEHADYMAMTSERLAGISYVVTGRRDEGSQFDTDRKAAKDWRERGTALREERRDLQKQMDERVYDDVDRHVKDLQRGVYSQNVPSGKVRRENSAGRTERKEVMYGQGDEAIRDYQKGSVAPRDLPQNAQPEPRQYDPNPTRETAQKTEKDRPEREGEAQKEMTEGKRSKEDGGFNQAAYEAYWRGRSEDGKDTGRSMGGAGR